MIAKNELRGYCKLTGFNLGQVEKDYLQHLLLILLSRHSSNELVFKGGTALQKVCGLNRFSIDLDFTQKEEINFPELMGKITRSMTDFGYESEYKETKTLGKTFRITTKGPLYNNTPISASTLRVEISQREHILIEPQLKQITPIYRDLQPYTLLVMQESEILAEKIRAIISRNKPRDIFDLHFLLKKGVKFDLGFINKKLEYYKEKFDKEKFISSIMEKKPIWEKEMRQYLNAVTNFEIILKEIKEALELV